MEKKYPIGGYAPGDYWHKACKTCGKEFTGDKRAWNCEPCGEKNAADEKKFIAKFGYEDLFDYLSHNHGLNLLQSEMSDLIDMVHRFHPKPTGPRWIKADQKPEHNVGVLVFIPGEDNHITSGMWDVSNEWVLLDEYRTPEEEVTHWMALPGLPEGVEPNELPDEWVRELKKIARDELGPDESGQ